MLSEAGKGQCSVTHILVFMGDVMRLPGKKTIMSLTYCWSWVEKSRQCAVLLLTSCFPCNEMLLG